MIVKERKSRNDKGCDRENVSPETMLMRKGVAGDYFYTEKHPRIMTAQATYNKRKITTQMFTGVDRNTGTEVVSLTKVTIIK